MSCDIRLLNNIGFDCSKPAKAGLETKALLINRADIDKTALTLSGAAVTNISLTSGATAYSIGWVKQLGSTASSFVANENGLNKFSHTFNCRIFGQGVEDAHRVAELANGEYVLVVQTKWGAGTDEAFKIYGLTSGLFMTEGAQNSGESDASFTFVLASQEGFEEQYHQYIWKEGTYAAMKAKFDARLVD
ncbi:hypothetical protein [Flavobacterium sp.]|uniref:hypothetical protein n=1 Tax=Flavobacterium sp. TaxID=239 RepID=UPI004033417B